MPDDLISLVVCECSLSVLQEKLLGLFLDVTDDSLAIFFVEERCVLLLSQVASCGGKFVNIFIRSVNDLFGS